MNIKYEKLENIIRKDLNLSKDKVLNIQDFIEGLNKNLKDKNGTPQQYLLNIEGFIGVFKTEMLDVETEDGEIIQQPFSYIEHLTFNGNVIQVDMIDHRLANQSEDVKNLLYNIYKIE